MIAKEGDGDGDGDDHDGEDEGFGKLRKSALSSSQSKLRSSTVPFDGTTADQPSPLLKPLSQSQTSLSGMTRSSSWLLALSGAEQYGSMDDFLQNRYKIRFQVVVWYVGKIDVAEGKVPMTFRVTMFWNDPPPPTAAEGGDEDGDDFRVPPDLDHNNNNSNSNIVGLDTDIVSVGSRGSTRSSRASFWQMHGRQRAVQREHKDAGLVDEIDVPPLSILNVVTFDTIGAPDVCMLRDDTRLMRWSCMYKAMLIQPGIRVDRFPHDRHDLVLKLGILAHRSRGSRWDRNVWKLALATEQDSQGSTRVPHGLVVDQVTIPDFHLDKEKGLRFDFVPLDFGSLGGGDGGGGGFGSDDNNSIGPGSRSGKNAEQCLEVKLSIARNSGYYDHNIMPLLILLNTVAIGILILDASMVFQRALLTLNIAFVEISIRMTVDKHLPSVGYQIKIQRILNWFFGGLLCLVLEACLVYALHHSYGVSLDVTDAIDAIAALISLAYIAAATYMYYSDLLFQKEPPPLKPS